MSESPSESDSPSDDDSDDDSEDDSEDDSDDSDDSDGGERRSATPSSAKSAAASRVQRRRPPPPPPRRGRLPRRSRRARREHERGGRREVPRRLREHLFQQPRGFVQSARVARQRFLFRTFRRDVFPFARASRTGADEAPTPNEWSSFEGGLRRLRAVRAPRERRQRLGAPPRESRRRRPFPRAVAERNCARRPPPQRPAAAHGVPGRRRGAGQVRRDQLQQVGLVVQRAPSADSRASSRARTSSAGRNTPRRRRSASEAARAGSRRRKRSRGEPPAASRRRRRRRRRRDPERRPRSRLGQTRAHRGDRQSRRRSRRRRSPRRQSGWPLSRRPPASPLLLAGGLATRRRASPPRRPRGRSPRRRHSRAMRLSGVTIEDEAARRDSLPGVARRSLRERRASSTCRRAPIRPSKTTPRPRRVRRRHPSGRATRDAPRPPRASRRTPGARAGRASSREWSRSPRDGRLWPSPASPRRSNAQAAVDISSGGAEKRGPRTRGWRRTSEGARGLEGATRRATPPQTCASRRGTPARSVVRARADERNANARIVTRATKRVVDSWFESFVSCTKHDGVTGAFAPFPRVAPRPASPRAPPRASGGFRVAAFGRKTNDQIS